MNIVKHIKVKKLLALLAAVIIYYFQKRLGMAVISFLLIDLILNKAFKLNRRTLLYVIIGIALFIIGHKLSLFLVLSCFYVPIKVSFVNTFTAGFIGGVIELELYLLITLFPMKVFLSKELKPSLKYLYHTSVICFIIGGLVQGSYLAGWQDLLYI